MELRLRVHAGAHRQALIAAIVLAAVPAAAAPSGPDAKKEFDKGVAAYQKSDFAGAAAAFARSASLEVDAETLFAWAQAERKLDHCDKASELYAKLLAMDLPAENKSVIRGQIAECKKILDAQPRPEPPAEPAKAEPPAEPVVSLPPSPSEPAARPWYRDPVGDTLAIAGVVGLGLGGALLVSAHSAQQGIATAPDYPTAKSLHDDAATRGTIGSISMIAGGALAISGVAWYLTHGTPSGPAVSAWLAPGSGGVALAGGF